MMTSKERLLGAIKGKEIDRVPWSPFLAYYWENLPQSERTCGQVEYLKKMEADPLLRGFACGYRAVHNNCNITISKTENKKYTTYETPVGNIVLEYTYSSNARSWFLTGHPVKSEEDFKVLQYIYEHTVIEDNASSVEEMNNELGEEGLLLPTIGVCQKTAFQSLVEHWCGTVDLIYALDDFPEVVEECLSVMQEKDMDTVKVSVKTSAEGFIFWEDSSTTNINPDLFAKYTAPEVDEWGKLIHSHDKLLIHHACGHIKDLIPLMCKTEIDMIESISPPPTGNIEIRDAVKLMPDNIGIIGGLEPTFLKNCSLEELEKNVSDLLTIMSDKRFILANSDSCPPGVEYEKFILVSNLIRKR